MLGLSSTAQARAEDPGAQSLIAPAVLRGLRGHLWLVPSGQKANPEMGTFPSLCIGPYLPWAGAGRKEDSRRQQPREPEAAAPGKGPQAEGRAGTHRMALRLRSMASGGMRLEAA